jgi:hypothetical protein
MCETRKRFPRFLIHLDEDGLTGGFEEGQKSSSHCSPGVVDLVLAMCVASLSEWRYHAVVWCGMHVQ